MTLDVLDSAAIWPYMNPATYPDPVTVTLTPEIYSDAQGTWDDTPFKVDTLLQQPITHLTVWGGERIDAMQVAYGGVLGPRMDNTSGGFNTPPSGGDFVNG
jgi:hypothetical protein